MKSVAEHATLELGPKLNTESHFTLSYIESEDKQVTILLKRTIWISHAQQFLNSFNCCFSTNIWSITFGNFYILYSPDNQLGGTPLPAHHQHWSIRMSTEWGVQQTRMSNPGSGFQHQMWCYSGWSNSSTDWLPVWQGFWLQVHMHWVSSWWNTGKDKRIF